MSKSHISGLVAVLALAAGGLMATQAWSQGAQPKPLVSQALAKTFKEAQEAQQAKRWPDVISKAKAVLAGSNRKPDDTYYAYALLFDANRAQGNTAEAISALEGEINSGFLSPPQQVPLLKAVAGFSFQSKDYDKAIDYGQRLIKNETADPEVYTYVGQSYYMKANYAESARFFNSLVNEQIKRGQTPREPSLQLLESSYNKLGNKSAETDVLEKLVRYYPKPNYWDALLYQVRSIPSLESRQRLWVWRLMWATGTLKRGQDFLRFADDTGAAGLPAETQKVYEAGLKANAFSNEEKPSAERRMASAAKIAASDQAAVPTLEAQAKAAATGELDVTLGMALYSYGDAAKAVEALQRGLAKGGLKDHQAIDAAMALGMAQQRTKDNAGAQKTFQGIKANDPNMQRIAQLWLLYVM